MLTCATVGPTSSSVCSAPFSKAALNSEAGGGGVAVACAGGDCELDALALLPRLLAPVATAVDVEVALALLPPEGAAVVGLSAASGMGAAGTWSPLLAAVGDGPSAVSSTAIIRQSEQALRRLRPDIMVPLSRECCHSVCRCAEGSVQHARPGPRNAPHLCDERRSAM
jgi:hypothetical protein